MKELPPISELGYLSGCCFHLGCRINEALAIKVDDIDFDHSAVTIMHLKSRLKLSCSSCGARLGATHVYCPRCGGKIEKSQAGSDMT